MNASFQPVTISAQEAAAVLGVSKPVLYQLMGREDFPSFKVGRRRLIPLDGLREWAEAQAKAGGTI